MDDMQGVLQQALSMRGGQQNTQGMGPVQGEVMGGQGMGEPTAEEVQAQLQQVLQAAEQTEDPAELEQLMQAASQLQQVLEGLQSETPQTGGGYGSDEDYGGY